MKNYDWFTAASLVICIAILVDLVFMMKFSEWLYGKARAMWKRFRKATTCPHAQYEMVPGSVLYCRCKKCGERAVYVGDNGQG